MAVIVLKVVRSLGRWAVMHNDVVLASFDTRPEADKAALTLATHHPAHSAAEVDLTNVEGGLSAIRVF